MEERPENARSRPSGAASANVYDVPWPVIEEIDGNETLHLRQARRIGDRYKLGETAARIIAN